MERVPIKNNKSEGNSSSSEGNSSSIEEYDFFIGQLEDGFSTAESAFNEQLYAIHKILEDTGSTITKSSLNNAVAVILDAERNLGAMVDSRPHPKPLEAGVRKTIAQNIEACKEEILAIKRRLDEAE